MCKRNIHYLPAPWVTITSKQEKLHYQIIAVIEQIDNSGGHIAHVLEDSRWFICDDDVIMDTGNPRKKTPENPYLILYQRIGRHHKHRHNTADDTWLRSKIVTFGIMFVILGLLCHVLNKFINGSKLQKVLRRQRYNEIHFPSGEVF